LPLRIAQRSPFNMPAMPGRYSLVIDVRLAPLDRNKSCSPVIAGETVGRLRCVPKRKTSIAGDAKTTANIGSRLTNSRLLRQKPGFVVA